MKKFLLAVIVLGMVFALAGCMTDKELAVYDKTKFGNSAIAQEILDMQDNQKRLAENQPPPKLDYSIERENLIKRLELLNDRNKVSYIYLISYGKVMAFYTIRGKATSLNSYLTVDASIIADPHGGSPSGSLVIPGPDFDGSYGYNDNGIFFFTTDGVYVEWKGEYMMCDQPLKLSTPPELVLDITK